MQDSSYIFLPDLHIGFEHGIDIGSNKFIRTPVHNKKLIRRILQFCTDLQPDFTIFGGDQFDFASVSRFNAGNTIAAHPGAIEEEFSEWNDIFGKNCDKIPSPNLVWLEGNHDVRLAQFAAKHPQLGGLCNPIVHLGIKPHTTVAQGGLFKLGKLFFTHGDNISYRGDVAKNAVSTYYRNILFGHYHTYRAFTLQTALDESPKTAIAVPAAGAIRSANWAKNKPNSCLNGFAYGFVTKKGNFHNTVVVETPEGFKVSGKLY